MPPELLSVGGPLAALVAAIGGLFLALKSGALVPGAWVDRMVAQYEAQLQRERDQTDRWQAAHDLQARANDTLSETARLTADQNARLASGQELTERLIDSLRQRVT